MPAAEHPLGQWLTGVVGRPPTTADGRRTVVVEDLALLPRLVASGLVDDDTTVLVRISPKDHDAPRVDLAARYQGSFAVRDAHLLFDNGFRLDSRQYGAAEFLGYESLTVLRITDPDDFSAYLRDADTAWATGTFGDHVTNPNVIIPELAGLGGPATRSGPTRRLFVSTDAGVSTSPTGRYLGSANDELATLDDRWRQANRASAFPDAVCLDGVLEEDDRTAALLERPWIGRYLIAVDVIRGIRRDHRQPSTVSGFGGRITGGLAEPSSPDPLAAPLLVRVGNVVQAHDPATDRSIPLSGRGTALLEVLLAHSDRRHAAQWCTSFLGIEEAQAGTHILDTLRLLSAAGVAERWSEQVGQGWDQPVEYGQSSWLVASPPPGDRAPPGVGDPSGDMAWRATTTPLTGDPRTRETADGST